MAEQKKLKIQFNVEVALNRWVQKLFPIWYASQSCKEIELEPIGILNPQSFLQSRWINAHTITQQIIQSLSDDEKLWGGLQKLLSELIVVRELRKNINIDLFSGVNFSEKTGDYLNLLAYAQHHCNEIPAQTNEDFEANLLACFPETSKPIQVGYREWDGRYFWQNEQEPLHLGALILQNSKGNRRDVVIPAQMQVHCFKSSVIDQISNRYWCLVLHQNSIAVIEELLEPTGFERRIVSFSTQKPHLRLLIADKKNKAFNRTIFNLLLSHSNQQVVDLFRYFQRVYKPFK